MRAPGSSRERELEGVQCKQFSIKCLVIIRNTASIMMQCQWPPPRDRGDGCRVGLIIGMAFLQAMQDEALEKSLGTPCRQVSLSLR